MATEILLSSKNFDLAAQAKYELGCLQYHDGNHKLAVHFTFTPSHP